MYSTNEHIDTQLNITSPLLHNQVYNKMSYNKQASALIQQIVNRQKIKVCYQPKSKILE